MSEIVAHRRTRQLKGQLTDLNLRNLTTRDGPYKVADGNGLFVLVSPTGLRAWRWKYRYAGREKMLPLGRYPEVSLAQARAARDEARKKVLAGRDPADERRDTKLALLTAHQNSFEAVARAWHKVWAVGKHARYAEDVMARLDRNVLPNIGHKPVAHIEPKDIVRMMERNPRSWRQRYCAAGAQYAQSDFQVRDYSRSDIAESCRRIQAIGCSAAAYI